jgi:hypothetical protein
LLVPGPPVVLGGDELQPFRAHVDRIHQIVNAVSPAANIVACFEYDDLLVRAHQFARG